MTTLLLKLTSDFSVRGIVAPDGNQRFSVFDFICVACQKSITSNYGRVMYARLLSADSEFKEDNEIVFIKFPGPGQRETPTVCAEGLLKILNLLGGKVSQAFRLEAFHVLERYLNGDLSLCSEIDENKAVGKREELCWIC
jgi:hypothetical protein